MRRPFRPSLASLLGAAALTTGLLASSAVQVVAKEGLEARLDAPIAMGTEGGTEILVGITVTAPGDAGPVPVEGSPIYLKLFGPTGAMTREAGAGDRRPAGHYSFRIAIPEGGAREIEVGIHGTYDLPIMVVGERLVFGDITTKTAQHAPPLAVASARPAATAAPVPAAAPAAATEPAGGAPLPIAPILVLALSTTTALTIAVRRRARAGRPARAA